MPFGPSSRAIDSASIRCAALVGAKPEKLLFPLSADGRSSPQAGAAAPRFSRSWRHRNRLRRTAARSTRPARPRAAPATPARTSLGHRRGHPLAHGSTPAGCRLSGWVPPPASRRARTYVPHLGPARETGLLLCTGRPGTGKLRGHARDGRGEGGLGSLSTLERDRYSVIATP